LRIQTLTFMKLAYLHKINLREQISSVKYNIYLMFIPEEKQNLPCQSIKNNNSWYNF